MSNNLNTERDMALDIIMSFLKYNSDEYEQVESNDKYVINILLEHFNSIQETNDTLFKTLLNNKNDNKNDIKTSNVIKGDYIKLEEINLHEVFNSSFTDDLSVISSEKIYNNFTERFSEI